MDLNFCVGNLHVVIQLVFIMAWIFLSGDAASAAAFVLICDLVSWYTTTSIPPLAHNPAANFPFSLSLFPSRPRLLLPCRSRRQFPLPHRRSCASTPSQFRSLGRLPLRSSRRGRRRWGTLAPLLDRVHELTPELLGYAVVGGLVIGVCSGGVGVVTGYGRWWGVVDFDWYCTVSQGVGHGLEDKKGAYVCFLVGRPQRACRAEYPRLFASCDHVHHARVCHLALGGLLSSFVHSHLSLQ